MISYYSVIFPMRMRTSFLDYAMSVIVARALPDARDGLKPGAFEEFFIL